MRQLSLFAYIPKNSFLHRLQVITKLFVSLTYIIIIFMSHTPLALLSLCLIIVVTTLFLGLPLRNRAITFVTIFLLFLSIFMLSDTTVGARLIVAWGKIVCSVMILTLFSMTTKLSEIFQLVSPTSSKMTVLHSILYIIHTTLAILPSIQYDLQRAVDAETIRRGRRVTFYSFGAWVTILTVVLVRALTRAERLADTVIDRGYLPSKGLTPLGQQSLQWQDIVLATLSITPGLIILKL